jgi:hypothetical protein
VILAGVYDISLDNKLIDFPNLKEMLKNLLNKKKQEE